MEKIMEKEKGTTIALNISTVERLKQFGEFSETYDDLLNRLLDKIKKKK